jgi:hypothetical protein
MRFLYQKIELLAGTAFATLQRHATDHPQADVSTCSIASRW